MNKRKSISAKIRLKVLALGNYTCAICGRGPITNKGLALEVDHILPFSKGGADDLSNFQILCTNCNRGKGADPSLNRQLKNDLDLLLNKINPQILPALSATGKVRVVANEGEFSQIVEKNCGNEFYLITAIPNVIMGFQAGYNLGIYTLNDFGGSKTNFEISCNKS